MRVVALLAAIAAGAGLSPAYAAEPTAVAPPPAAPAEQPRTPEPEAAPARPVPSAPGAAASSQASPPRDARPRPTPPSMVVRIDLTAQRMTVAAGGETLHAWPISSGREGFATPRGVFRPQWTARMWYSRKYDNAPMPHSVFFNGGVAVHATQATGLLGRPASHGCVRLAPGPAATFYGLVQRHGLRNVRIEVFGSPPPSAVAGRREPVRPPVVARHIERGISVGTPSWSGPVRTRQTGMIHLPPGHPFKGRDSFQLNGVTYVRVR